MIFYFASTSSTATTQPQRAIDIVSGSYDPFTALFGDASLPDAYWFPWHRLFHGRARSRSETGDIEPMGNIGPLGPGPEDDSTHCRPRIHGTEHFKPKARAGYLLANRWKPPDSIFLDMDAVEPDALMPDRIAWGHSTDYGQSKTGSRLWKPNFSAEQGVPGVPRRAIEYTSIPHTPSPSPPEFPCVASLDKLLIRKRPKRRPAQLGSHAAFFERRKIRRERPSGIFSCTFRCGESYSTYALWKRHEEEKHLALDRYICALTGTRDSHGGCLYCSKSATLTPPQSPNRIEITPVTSVCAARVYCSLSVEELTRESRQDDTDLVLSSTLSSGCEAGCFHNCATERTIEARTFGRKDHLIQHLESVHGVTGPRNSVAVQELCKKWRQKIKGPSQSRCGFCPRGKTFIAWNFRSRHVAKHFSEGRKVQEWDTEGLGFDAEWDRRVDSVNPAHAHWRKGGR